MPTALEIQRHADRSSKLFNRQASTASILVGYFTFSSFRFLGGCITLFCIWYFWILNGLVAFLMTLAWLRGLFCIILIDANFLFIIALVGWVSVWLLAPFWKALSCCLVGEQWHFLCGGYIHGVCISRTELEISSAVNGLGDEML
jgi:hypothetical protein